MATPRRNSTLSAVAKPNMGDTDNEGAWCGGEPQDLTWKASKNEGPFSILCYRTGPNTGLRAYTQRVTGTSTKFKKEVSDYDLHTFSNDVSRHLKNHGMDSIFWIPDKKYMLRNIIFQHSLFTIDRVITHVKSYQTYIDTDVTMPGDTQVVTQLLRVFDKYDIDNLNAAREFLLSSIDPNMKKMINPFITDTTTGPEIWMRIVSEFQSTSIQRLDHVRKQLESVKLKQFKGENVKGYADHVSILCKDLDYGHRLPETILFNNFGPFE